MTKNPNRQQTEAKINVRAWKDPAFKEKLMKDPRSALKEMGMSKIPDVLSVQTIEEKRNQWIIRLQERPLNYRELSEEALEKCATGEHQEAKCCPKKPG